MTWIQRIQSVVTSLFMILTALLLFLEPDIAWGVITLAVLLSLFLAALRAFIFYFSMAQHMVGGRTFLYRALILCDLAVFTGALTEIHRIYIVAYLLFLFGFSGLVDLLRALESRRMGGNWQFNAFRGIFNIAMAALCLIFFRLGRPVEIVYGISLIDAAVLRLISAFRRTALTYIS